MRALFCLFFVLSGFSAFAQKQDTLLRVVTYNAADKVELKWLPANYEVWIAGMKSGYLIDRYELQKVSGKWQMVAKVTLTKTPVKPWDDERIKREAVNNPDLKNIDMMIAGRDLNDKSKASGIAGNVDLQSNQNFTFILSLFAQVIKNKTSEAMGNYFEDKTAQPGKTYLYRVSFANDPKIKADVVVERKTLTTTPNIQGFSSKNIHKGVELYWLNPKSAGYIYYDVYRSESKTGNFIKLNEYPFIGDIGIITDSKRLRYTDTFPQLDKPYYYKVVGINAFEKQSAASVVLEVEPSYFLQQAPQFEKAMSSNNKDIYLSWQVAEAEKPFVKSFALYSGTSAVGPFKKVNSKPIDGKTYEYNDLRTNKPTFNYYTICAYGNTGDSTCSIPKDVFLVDSLAPVPPIVVSGICDTNGVVTLKWKKGPEADIIGYRVFRTYYKHKEPVRITVEYVTDTMIVDTVEVKSGWKKVYYGVAAIDQVYNPSPLSVYYAVPMPDFNPPVNALFKEYVTGYGGITLKWQPSPSEDIKTQYLMRKSEFDFAWQPYLKLSGDSLKITQFRDTLTKSNIWYEYALVAEDSSGLKSKPSESLRIQQPEKNPFPVVKNVQVFVSKDNKMIKLTWDFDMNAVGFKIMRSKKGEPVQTYEFVPGSKREFYDKWLTPNTEYNYAIIAEIPDGRQSLMSKKVIAKY